MYNIYYSIFIIQYIFFFFFSKHNYRNIVTWVIKVSENEYISENYECAFFDKGARRDSCSIIGACIKANSNKILHGKSSQHISFASRPRTKKNILQSTGPPN